MAPPYPYQSVRVEIDEQVVSSYKMVSCLLLPRDSGSSPRNSLLARNNSRNSGMLNSLGIEPVRFLVLKRSLYRRPGASRQPPVPRPFE